MSLAAILAKYRDLNTICVGDRCQVIHDLGERELRQMPAEAPHVLRSEQVRFVHWSSVNIAAFVLETKLL